MTDERRILSIAREAEDARLLDPYRAVAGLWLCVVKLEHTLPRVAAEHEQIASMLRQLSRDQAHSVVSAASVDILLNLDPPLETILVDEAETLFPLPAARELGRIRDRRWTDPKAALAALLEVLQRIRNAADAVGSKIFGP